MRASTKARALVVGTIAAAGGALAAAPFMATEASLTTIALFGAAVVLMELIQVPSDETSLDPGDRHSLSFSSGVHIAAAIVVGPWIAAAVAAFGVLVVDRARGSKWRHILYNASVFALATLAGGFAFEAAGGTSGAVDLPPDFAALVALAVAYTLANNAFMSAVVAVETSRPYLPLARETTRDGLSEAVGEAGLGIALAVFALNEPWAVVALAPLVLAVYRSYERLARLRRETAHALETFANVIDERDMSTFQHSARVSEYAGRLAEALGLEDGDVARIAWAGRLHDLGKIAVDASVLRKPSRLAEDEWTAMRRHPRLSARLLRRFRFAEEEARAVEYHHERFDGGGYYGIDPGAIPLAAHFLIVADSYDAMTSDRSYRRGLPAEEALAEIERHAGSQFHPALAKAFVALQRGEDAAAVLTEDELVEIRSLGRRRRRRWLSARAPFPVELAPPVTVVAGLVALAAGRLFLAAVGFCAAALAFALAKVEDRRGDRLAARLAGVLAPPASRAQAFARFRGEFAALCDLKWAGVLTWRERECIGLLELEWSGGAQAPSETSLCGWMVREVETNSPVIVVPGAELGREYTHLAVPLQRGDELVGCLFVAVAGRIPRSLREALGSVAPELTARLAPDEGQALARRLEAVAS